MGMTKDVVAIETPVTDGVLEDLKIGKRIHVNGILYSARDAAHKRLIEALESGNDLPFDIEGQIIYYVGPTPAKPGKVVGAAGPTSSYRMDSYTPKLLEKGLKGMIGKGARGREAIAAMKKHRAVYMAATGGAGALISKCIQKVELVAYEDLGAEAIRKLTVKNFPAIVVNDIYGNDLYEAGKRKYRKM